MELNYIYDVKKIMNDYKDKNPTCKYGKYLCVTSLNLLKKELNIKYINVETLNQINEWMKYYIVNESASSNYNRLNRTSRKILSFLFNYKFKCLQREYLSNDNYFKNLINEYENNEIIKQLIDKFIQYLNTTNLAESTKKHYFRFLLHTFIPLKDNFINNNITRENIINQIQDIENNSKDEITTKIQDFTNILSNLTEKVLDTFNKLIKSEIISSLKNIKLITKQEIIPKNRKINHTDKDYFSEEELEQLNKNTTDIREKLLLTIFLSTGVRIGGLINMKVTSVFDENFNVLKIGETLEKKGNKIRKFVIFLPLKQALENYIKSEYSKKLKYTSSLFLNTFDQPLSIWSLRIILKNIFVRAEMTGPNTHPHAFRKTLVIKLMNEGNSLENVSKFIGHSSAAVTAKHYWVPTQQDLLKNMNMQWLLGENNLKKLDDKKLASISSKTLQLEKITSTLMEGFMAKERLTHAMSLMTLEQIDLMEKMWTDESKQNVSKNLRYVITNIIDNSSIFSDLSSIISEN